MTPSNGFCGILFETGARGSIVCEKLSQDVDARFVLILQKHSTALLQSDSVAPFGEIGRPMIWGRGVRGGPTFGGPGRRIYRWGYRAVCEQAFFNHGLGWQIQDLRIRARYPGTKFWGQKWRARRVSEDDWCAWPAFTKHDLPRKPLHLLS